MKTIQVNKKSKKIKGEDIIRKFVPGVEEISEKANEIYLQRMERGEPGSAESDWLEAEKYLLDSKR